MGVGGSRGFGLSLGWVEITLRQLDLGFSEVLAAILGNHKADFPDFACELWGYCSVLAHRVPLSRETWSKSGYKNAKAQEACAAGK